MSKDLLELGGVINKLTDSIIKLTDRLIKLENIVNEMKGNKSNER